MRYLPPVYSPLSTSAIARSGLSLEPSDRAGALCLATKQLEERYPEHGVLLTDSGTSALTLALMLASGPARAIGHGPSHVALPAYGCPDLGTAAVGAGLGVILYDLDPSTLAPDADSLRQALSDGAGAVVVTHLYGRVMDLGPIKAMAEAFGATVIEDAAQHAGGAFRGIRGGGQADHSILSFGRGKGINAGGGGALLVRRTLECPLPLLSERSGATAHIAKALITEWLSNPHFYGVVATLPFLGIGQSNYHAPSPPRKMLSSEAAMLSFALSSEHGELSLRQRREAHYRERLASRHVSAVSLIDPCEETGALRMPLLIESDWAERRRADLSRKGIVRSYPRTLQAYPELARVITRSRSPLSGSELLAERLHTIPTHRLVGDHEAENIVALLSRD